MINQQVDILIVGGGLAGASLAQALTHLGYDTLLVEAKPFVDQASLDFDVRTLALSPASVRILQALQIWPLLVDEATPIKSIHVSEQHRFGHTRLRGEEGELLGHVVEMPYISRALYRVLDPTRLLAPAELTGFDKATGVATIRCATEERMVQTRLLVAADGTDSPIRRLCGITAEEKEYGAHAVVTNVGLARPHHHQAYERFTASGPLALLPMTAQRMSLVWSLPPTDAARLMMCSEDDFLKALQAAFGYRLGRFVKVGQRGCYPLRQVVLSTRVSGSVVFVGNAAHTLHPVAGQGFNLGLRDVAMLAQCIVSYGIGSQMLQAYEEARIPDQTMMTALTDGLVQLFTSQLPGLAVCRGLGLWALDNLSFLKHELVHGASGFSGMAPDLVCGIPLESRNEPIV